VGVVLVAVYLSLLFCTNVYVVLVGIYGSKYEVCSSTVVTKQDATGKTEVRISTSMVFPFILVLQCESFIMSLSNAALWRRKPAPARTSRNSCRAHKRKKHPVRSRIDKHCLAVLRVIILPCGMWYCLFWQKHASVERSTNFYQTIRRYVPEKWCFIVIALITWNPTWRAVIWCVFLTMKLNSPRSPETSGNTQHRPVIPQKNWSSGNTATRTSNIAY
jgi:hypothetical protein